VAIICLSSFVICVLGGLGSVPAAMADAVAAARDGKAYASFHLMPVYAFPDLIDAASPQLRKRMQGKSCFNFSRVDEALMTELEDLTARGIERFRERGVDDLMARSRAQGH